MFLLPSVCVCVYVFQTMTGVNLRTSGALGVRIEMFVEADFTYN